ncbi:MAG: BrnT family toxin [Beijerinckiaceae bacterium]
MKFDGFDWDRGNIDKCRKHGLSLTEIETALSGEIFVTPDPAHSAREQRFHAIGRTATGRAVFVVFTLRERGGEMLLRPISARYMHRKEIEAHEKEAP